MKVIITDYEYENVEKEKKIVEEAGFSFCAYQCKSEEDLIQACKDADAVIVQYSEITKTVIQAMEHCQVIIKYGIGVNNIDTEAASEKEIYVCNVPDYGVDEVSNHAVTMIMALSKKLIQIDRSLKNGVWGYQPIEPLYRMAGKTLGLVGIGRIPSSVAKKMKGFDLRILAYDPFVSQEEGRKRGVEMTDFETLVKESDYISIHCPLTEDTTHLFNEAVFKKMKNTAVLVNTARGAIIDEEALIQALQVGEIAGAGLDVFEKEPIEKDNPLLHMNQVICTPHCAWYTLEAIDAVQSKAALEAVNVLQGNAPWNAVNRKKVENGKFKKA